MAIDWQKQQLGHDFHDAVAPSVLCLRRSRPHFSGSAGCRVLRSQKHNPSERSASMYARNALEQRGLIVSGWFCFEKKI